MTKSQFLASSPRELDGYFEQIELRQHLAFQPAALICSVIANVNRDSERKPEPWRVEDFMPGAESDEDNMRDFCAKVAAGFDFRNDPMALDAATQAKSIISSREKTKRLPAYQQGKPC
jgi:hypothetical protein